MDLSGECGFQVDSNQVKTFNKKAEAGTWAGNHQATND